MGSVQIFELNLKQNKKEKSITLQAEKQESFDEGNSNDDESLVLLTKIFNKFLKKMNKRNIPKSSKRSNNFQKSKKPINAVE